MLYKPTGELQVACCHDMVRWLDGVADTRMVVTVQKPPSCLRLCSPG